MKRSASLTSPMVPSCSISDGWLCRPRFPPLASGGILSRRSGARRLPSHVSRTPRVSCNVARARPLARLSCSAARVKAGDRPAHLGGWPSTIGHNRGGSSACFVPRPWGKSKDSSQPGDPNVTFRPHVDKDRNVEPNEIVVGMGCHTRKRSAPLLRTKRDDGVAGRNASSRRRSSMLLGPHLARCGTDGGHGGWEPCRSGWSEKESPSTSASTGPPCLFPDLSMRREVEPCERNDCVCEDLLPGL